MISLGLSALLHTLRTRKWHHSFTSSIRWTSFFDKMVTSCAGEYYDEGDDDDDGDVVAVVEAVVSGVVSGAAVAVLVGVVDRDGDDVDDGDDGHVKCEGCRWHYETDTHDQRHSDRANHDDVPEEDAHVEDDPS